MRRLSNGFRLACIICLGAAVLGVYMNPGLVAPITQKGVDYAAEAAVRRSKRLIANGGIPLDDHDGTFNGYIGETKYTFSDVLVTKLERVRLGAMIDEDNGLLISLRIAEVLLRGSLNYRFSVLRIPMGSNRLTFNLTLSRLSLNFTASLEIDWQARMVEKSALCDASISSVKLSFEPKDTWMLKVLGSSGDSMKGWLLSETICTKIENAWIVVISDTNRYLRMCLLGTCTLMLVLLFVTQPLFGKGYVETAHAVELLGHDGARIVPPFVPRPFRRLQEHRRILTVYLSPYVANSMLYTLYRSGQLVYKATNKDLLAKLQVGSCKVGFCLARFLDRYLLNSGLEVEFSATSCPRVELSANITMLTIQSDLTIKTLSDNSTTSTLARFPTNVFITGKAYIDDNRLCFNITDGAAKQTGKQDFTGVKNGIAQLLAKIFEREILSKFSELGKVGIPLPDMLTSAGKFLH